MTQAITTKQARQCFDQNNNRRKKKQDINTMLLAKLGRKKPTKQHKNPKES